MGTNNINNDIKKVNALTKKNNIEQLFFICVVALVLLLGFHFRINNYSVPISFDVDEAQIARYLNFENGLSKTIDRFGSSRPLAYLLVSKILNDLKSNEQVLRLTSIIPSLLTLLIVLLLSKKIYKSKITILVVLMLFLFNPFLISFSKIFKHYSLEVFIHILLLSCTINYLYNPIRKKIVTLCLATTASVFFSGPNIVFLFPSIYTILLIDTVTKKEYKNLIFVICSAVLTVFFLLMLYFLLWKNSITDFVNTWNTWYGGFPIQGINPFYWQIRQLISIVRYFFNYPSYVSEVHISNLLLTLLFLGMLSLAVRKSYRILLLLVFPFIPMLILNLLRYWPMGVDRTNLFLIVYLILITGFAFDYLLKNSFKLLSYAGAACSLSLIIYIAYINPAYYQLPRREYGTPYEDMRGPLDYLIRNTETNNKKKVLYLNYLGWIGFEYYVYHHDALSGKYRQFFEKNFQIITYKSRDDEYVYSKTKEVIEKAQKNSVFLLYHYEKESEAFFNAMENNASYNVKDFSGSAVIEIASLDSHILKVTPGIIFEAESCNINNRHIKSDTDLPEYDRTSGKYVIKSNITFRLAIKEAATYQILGKTIALNGNSDSWYISVNGENPKRWDIPHSKAWKWNQCPFEWNLKPGEHMVTFSFREPTPMDQILVRQKTQNTKIQ